MFLQQQSRQINLKLVAKSLQMLSNKKPQKDKSGMTWNWLLRNLLIQVRFHRLKTNPASKTELMQKLDKGLAWVGCRVGTSSFSRQSWARARKSLSLWNRTHARFQPELFTYENWKILPSDCLSFFNWDYWASSQSPIYREAQTWSGPPGQALARSSSSWVRPKFLNCSVEKNGKTEIETEKSYRLIF